MARINLEDQFFLDIIDVVERFPDQDKVIGNAVRFFRYAQEEHKRGKLISEKTFKQKGFLEALIPTFAERVEGGIQAVGAEKHFGWLAKKIEAGSKGGRSKSEAKLKNLKQNKADRSTTEAPPKQIEAPPKETTETLSDADFQVNSSPAPEAQIENTPKQTEAKPSITEASPSYSPSGFLNKKVSTNKVSAVAEKIGHADPPAAAGPVFFGIHRSLSSQIDDENVIAALSRISSGVQASWINRYDPAWLAKVLTNAVHHFMEKENALNAAEINEWGLKLGKWLRREKKPSLLDPRENFAEELEQLETQIQQKGGNHAN